MSLIAIIYKAVFLSVAFFLIMLAISYVMFLYRKKYKSTIPESIKPQNHSHAFTDKSSKTVYAENLPSYNSVVEINKRIQTVPQKAGHRELRKTRYDILNETMKKPTSHLSQTNQPEKYFGSSTLDFYMGKQLSE